MLTRPLTYVAPETAVKRLKRLKSLAHQPIILVVSLVQIDVGVRTNANSYFIFEINTQRARLTRTAAK